MGSIGTSGSGPRGRKPRGAMNAPGKRGGLTERSGHTVGGTSCLLLAYKLV